MLHHLARTILLVGVLVGLCPAVGANTTVGEAATTVSPSNGAPAASDSSTLSAPVTSPVTLPTTETIPLKPLVRIGLLLPLRSDALRQPAESVRAGFMAAFERDQEGIAVDIIETSDVPQEIANTYQAALARTDIIVGPLSRSGVTAIAQSGAVSKPTIALTQPDAEIATPPKMLLMGLSIEEEAKQVANWAGKDAVRQKAIVLSTDAAWQKRAAKAFTAQWQRIGREAEQVEVGGPGGYLNGRALLNLKKNIQADKSVLLFAALDANQAQQVRTLLGSQIPMYGTSQLNPLTLTDRTTDEPTDVMNGARLLDIPWQLQADHPAVMVYPRVVVSADQKPNADLERLYALGIDAYRVAHELAADRTYFQLDGVTGKLTIRFSSDSASFERKTPHAVYRDGGVVVDSK